MSEAGIEATKALIQSIPLLITEKDNAPEQERGHDETHIIIVVSRIRGHADGSKEIRCLDNIGNDTKIITKYGGAHTIPYQLASSVEIDADSRRKAGAKESI